MNKIHLYCVGLLMLLQIGFVYAQKNELTEQFQASQNTEQKITIANKLADILISSEPKEALFYAEKALQLANLTQNLEGTADAQANIGYIQGHTFSRPDLAYEAHQSAYNLYKKYYDAGKLNKEKFYDFLQNKAIPTYKFVKESDIHTRKYRKAIQKYEALNSQLVLDIAKLSKQAKEELVSDLANLANISKQTKEELEIQKNVIEEKQKHEIILSSEKEKLLSTLTDKEKEQLALIDSIYKKQAALDRAILNTTTMQLKQEEAENQAIKKDMEMTKQRDFNKILMLGLGLGFVLMLTVVWAFYVQRKANKRLATQNIEINQQSEEIAAQRDNIIAQNELLEKHKGEIEIQRDKSDALLLNILPAETAQELKEKGFATPKQYDLITVLFTDFKGFTNIAEKISPAEVVENLNTCFLAFDEICDKYGLEKIKTIGDSYMCAGGVPVANATNPMDVVLAGLEMQQWMKNWIAGKKANGQDAWELRLGIHSGEAVAGVVGKNKFAYDIWGDTVNLASRMESSGEVNKVNISGATYELVKDKFECVFRGKITAKGKGEIEMYFVNKLLG